MLLLPDKFYDAEHKEIVSLKNETALLQAELNLLETAIANFQSEIRLELAAQILLFRELTDIYKNRKKAKKQKRMEQRKRGKNYKQPVGLKRTDASFTTENLVSADERQEIKRLYKEAILQVHPDKLTDADEALYQLATSLTAQLNGFYNSGNLEELNRLHYDITSKKPVADSFEKENNWRLTVRFLQQQKQQLRQALQQIKACEIYNLYNSNNDTGFIINNLRIQFEARIEVLKKRTK